VYILDNVATELIIYPGGRALIPTGIKMALPVGFEAQVRPRSGLALKYGITVLNTPGTIDSDYRGDVGVVLINHGTEPFVVNQGDRIAQLVISQITQAQFVPVDELSETNRGAGGFGSTGSI
jgi:dUTP pyrophosphatase